MKEGEEEEEGDKLKEAMDCCYRSSIASLPPYLSASFRSLSSSSSSSSFSSSLRESPDRLHLSAFVPLFFSLPFFFVGFLLTLAGFVTVFWVSVFLVANGYWFSVAQVVQWLFSYDTNLWDRM